MPTKSAITTGFLAPVKTTKHAQPMRPPEPKLPRAGVRTPAAPRLRNAKPKSKYALLPARAEVIASEHVFALVDEERL